MRDPAAPRTRGRLSRRKKSIDANRKLRQVRLPNLASTHRDRADDRAALVDALEFDDVLLIEGRPLVPALPGWAHGDRSFRRRKRRARVLVARKVKNVQRPLHFRRRFCTARPRQTVRRGSLGQRAQAEKKKKAHKWSPHGRLDSRMAEYSAARGTARDNSASKSMPFGPAPALLLSRSRNDPETFWADSSLARAWGLVVATAAPRRTNPARPRPRVDFPCRRLSRGAPRASVRPP